MLESKDRYRDKKLAKMSESNHVSKKLAAAQGTQALATTAATIQTANSTWSWSKCVKEAKKMMEGFEEEVEEDVSSEDDLDEQGSETERSE